MAIAKKKNFFTKIVCMVLITLFVLSSLTGFATRAETTNTLLLQYDDRYDVSDYKNGYVVVSIENEKATSCVVENGEVTEDTDSSVLSLAYDSTTELIADGVGTATLVIAPEGAEDIASKQITINVTVKPAVLTLMLVAGQSNASGNVSTNTGSELNESIACDPGTVYSTYAGESAAYAARNGLSTYFSGGDASAFVPGDLTSNLSYAGEELEYDVNSLTSDGSGKLGIDSGLAYTWNELTGEKVFIVNAAWGGTSIADWQEDGDAYERALSIYELAIQTYIAEVESGHYTAGSQFVFWMQGEADRNKTAEYYEESFSAVCENFLTLGVTDDGWFEIDKIGVISVRAFTANYYGLEDVELTGPREAIYTMCGSSDYPYLYLVSNVGEQWVTDEGVEEYFAETYSEGYITYPTQGNSKYSDSLPCTVAEVHNDAHFSQTGHNENGITAAEGMYAAVYGDTVNGTEWRALSGVAITSLEIENGAVTTLVCSASQPSLSKELTYSVSDASVISYDPESGELTANNVGTAYIYAYADDSKIGAIEITVVSTVTTTGLVYDENELTWVYYTDGVIDTSYTGIASNDYGTYYVSAGYIDWTYCGPHEEAGITYYFYCGYASETGLLLETDGYLYYFADGVADTTYTGIAVSSYGTYYVVNGVVDYTVSGVYEINGVSYYISNNEVQIVSGLKQLGGTWYYVLSGIIQTDYTGLFLQTNGIYYYIENGICTLATTDIVTINGIKYYIYNSRLQTGKGVTTINGTYYYIEDDGTIDYTGLVTSSSGTVYYAENGIIDMSTTGVIVDTDGTGNSYYVVNSVLQTEEGLYEIDGAYYYVYEDGQVGSALSNADESAVLKQVDGIWYYMINGVVQTDYTGLFLQTNGVYYYIENGICTLATTVIYETGGISYYVKNSRLQTSTNGLVSVNGTWYYVADGVVQTNYTGLYLQTNGVTYYVENGICTLSSTLIYESDGSSYYIKNSRLQAGTTGLINVSETWYYIIEGVVQTDYSGLFLQTNGVTYYVENGICTLATTGLVIDTDKVYYVVNSRLKSGTGNTLINGTYYYINSDGFVDCTGVIEDISGIMYYVVNGVVDTAANGIYECNNIYYTVVDGVAEIYLEVEVPSVISVTATGTKTVKVMWSIMDADGFQIRYRVSGSSTWKTKTVTGIYKSSYVYSNITGLTTGTTYEVQIRAYVIENASDSYSGDTYYSAWTDVVTVTTK